MKIYVKYFYYAFSVFFVLYLLLPNFSFPKPPNDSIQSNEPADMEDNLRRAYFTNLDRNGIIDWYISSFNKKPSNTFKFLTLRFNYPPEESQSIIRDQTRSTYLEELVHPMRESLYVNGFEPTQEKDAIIIENRDWKQKIIIKFVPSNVIIRFSVGILILVIIPIVFVNFMDAINELNKSVKRILFSN